jgi:uncharacterized protein YneF (UPF0154 family)
MTFPTAQRAPIQIGKRGLTKAGVIVLQTLFISFFTLIELLFRHGIGISTGLAILIAVLGGVHLGRRGTKYVSVVNPPLAFAVVTMITISIMDGMHISKVGIDFIAALASAAPYLLLGATYGWFSYFKSRKSLG